MKIWLAIISMSTIVFGSTFAFAVERTVEIRWKHDGNDLAGFYLLQGDSSGNYGDPLNVNIPEMCADDANSYCYETVIDVPDGEKKTYYFAASAYDEGGNTSGLSNESALAIDHEVPPKIVDLTANYDDTTKTITFNWSYETNWQDRIQKWVLYESPSPTGEWTEVAHIPYSSEGAPSYILPHEIEAPDGERLVKYYVLVAHRSAENLGKYSENSNIVEVTVDRMPPKSPFELKVKIK